MPSIAQLYIKLDKYKSLWIRVSIYCLKCKNVFITLFCFANNVPIMQALLKKQWFLVNIFPPVPNCFSFLIKLHVQGVHCASLRTLLHHYCSSLQYIDSPSNHNLLQNHHQRPPASCGTLLNLIGKPSNVSRNSHRSFVTPLALLNCDNPPYCKISLVIVTYLDKNKNHSLKQSYYRKKP